MGTRTIWNKNQTKRVLFTKEIRSSVKDTFSLFQFLENNLQHEEIEVNTIDNTKFTFIKKIGTKKIQIEISDTERENFLEISVYDSRLNYLNGVYNWSNKQIFGLKYGLWIILIIVAISIIPLAVLLATQETISSEAQTALKVGGIVLISIGGGVFVLFLIFTQLSSGRQIKLRDNVSNFVQIIINFIDSFREDSKGKKVCWSCYKEITSESSKCPHCGIQL